MKPTLSLITALLLFTVSYAQKDKDIPAWGKIDKADLLLKECDIDKDADAMILVDRGDVDYQKGSHYDFAMRIEKRTRIKILKESAFERANVKIYYYSDDNYEKLIDVDAVTYNLDASGNIVETKVDKKSFFRQKVDASFSAMTFTFPDVKVGSILEYRSVVVREHFYNISPWSFQDNIPTRVSAFSIGFPEYFKFVANTRTGPGLETKKDESNRTIYIERQSIPYRCDQYYYKMKNLPALKNEPYMGSWRDYEQRLEFQLSSVEFPQQAPIDFRNTWPRLINSLLEAPYFGDQMKRNISMGDELEKAVKATGNPVDKLLIIFRNIQKNMDWDGEEWYGSENAKEAWSRKKGGSGDINMVLLNFLKEAGLEAYPVLASTRSHGKVYSAYPLLSQFNTLLVAAQVNDKIFVLDASDKYNPPGLIPYDVLGSEAFLVDKEKGGFITLWDSRNVYKHLVSMSANITEDDQMNGNANLNSSDYARNNRVKKFQEGKDKFTSYYLTGDVTNMKIEELEVNNISNDSLALEQRFKFSVPINSSGDYKYFTLNHFTGLEKNPFVSESRQTTVDFGYTQYYMMVGSITIPENHQFEEMPKNLMMIMPDTSIVFRRILETSGNRVNYRITLEFKRPYYEPDEYEEFREFYKKLYANLNEQIVFKKKAVPKP